MHSVCDCDAERSSTKEESFGWRRPQFTEPEAKQVPTAHNERVLLDFTSIATTAHSRPSTHQTRHFCPCYRPILTDIDCTDKCFAMRTTYTHIHSSGLTALPFFLFIQLFILTCVEHLLAIHSFAANLI